MKLLIFDLDGTLIDSRQDIVLSVNRAFLKNGFPEMEHALIGGEIGRGSEYLFRRLLGGDTSTEVIQSLSSRFREYYWRHLVDHTYVYPGVRETLAYYAETPKVIVTNKTQVLADRIVDELRLRENFEAVFGFEAFSTQKPDSGPVSEVCRRWKIETRDAIMIGDSVFDLMAGKAAGARTVGALYGFTQAEVLKRYEPDDCVESADQLMGLF